MASFERTLRAIHAMRDEHVIEDYAIAGAMAGLFWTKPIPTYDLDVLVWLPSGSERRDETVPLRFGEGGSS